MVENEVGTVRCGRHVTDGGPSGLLASCWEPLRFFEEYKDVIVISATVTSCSFVFSENNLWGFFLTQQCLRLQAGFHYHSCPNSFSR